MRRYKVQKPPQSEGIQDWFSSKDLLVEREYASKICSNGSVEMREQRHLKTEQMIDRVKKGLNHEMLPL